jgi:AraC-like DNA-binding protein
VIAIFGQTSSLDFSGRSATEMLPCIPVAQIASEVGYESEAAFNRAFKREFDIPPARFRTKSRSVRAKSAVA